MSIENDIANHLDNQLRTLMADTANTCERMGVSGQATAAILLSALWAEGLTLAFFAMQDEQAVRKAMSEAIDRCVKRQKQAGA